MLHKIITFFEKKANGKYGEFVRYALVGAVTTVINFSVYTLLYKLLRLDINLSNTVSVICANAYSYYGNKRHVFRSHCDSFLALLGEIGLFLSSRIGTILLEIAGVFVVVSLLREKPFVGKIQVVLLVTLINYVVGKFLIFRKGGKNNKTEQDTKGGEEK